MPNIAAPDGTVVNFPDSMSMDDISKVMADHFPAGGSGGNSTWEAAKAGVKNAMSDTGNLLGGLGSAASDLGIPSVGSALQTGGQFLKDHAPPSTYQPASVLSDVQAGNYGTAAGDFGKNLLANAPETAAVLGAGALTGPAGAAAVGGALGEGRAAGEAAQKAGRSTPSSSDMVAALPDAAVDTAAGAVRLGRGLSGNALGRVAGMAGVSDLDTAGHDLVHGQTPSLHELGDAAIQGAGMSAGMDLPGLVGKGVDPIANRMLTNAPKSAADAQAMKDAGDVFNEVSAQAAASRGQNARPTDLMNTVKTNLANRTDAYAKSLNTAGVLSDDLYDSYKAAMHDARVNNAALVSSGGVGSPTVFDDIVNSGINPDVLNPLVRGMRAMDAASSGSFLNKQTGPFRAIGGELGSMAGLHLPLVGNVGRYIGSKVGGMLDTAAGQNVPQALRQAQRGASYLGDNAATTSPIADLINANGVVSKFNNQPTPISVDVSGPSQIDPAVKAQQMDQMQAQQSRAQRLAAAQAAMKQSDYGKAEQATQQAPGATEAYLAGRGPSAPEPVGDTGMTLSQEMAVWSQMLANKQAAAKSGTQQQAVLNKAAAADPDAVAQANLNKRALANEATLNAGNLSVTHPMVQDPVAALAAQNAAAKAASRVANQATGSSPAADRAAVGLPTDAVPVNQPLPAGVGPSAPPRASTLVPDTREAVLAEIAPQAAQQAPSAPTGQPMDALAMHPQNSAAERFVANNDPRITRQMVHDATREVYPNADPAQVLSRGIDGPIAKPIQQVIAKKLLGIPTGGLNPGEEPVRDPTRYMATVQTYQNKATNLANFYRRGGNHALADAITDIAINHHMQSAKAAAKAALPKELQQFIPDWLVKHGGKG